MELKTPANAETSKWNGLCTGVKEKHMQHPACVPSGGSSQFPRIAVPEPERRENAPQHLLALSPCDEYEQKECCPHRIGVREHRRTQDPLHPPAKKYHNRVGKRNTGTQGVRVINHVRRIS